MSSSFPTPCRLNRQRLVRSRGKWRSRLHRQPGKEKELQKSLFHAIMAFSSWKRGAEWPRELSFFCTLNHFQHCYFSSLISHPSSFRFLTPGVPVPSSPHLGDDASIVVARQDRFLPPRILVSADRNQSCHQNQEQKPYITSLF